MINLFTLGLNQMIAMAEQMQRLESELLRMYLHNLSSVTERAGEISEQSAQSLRRSFLEEAKRGESYARAAQSASGAAALRRASSQSRPKAGATPQAPKPKPKKRGGGRQHS